MTTPDPADDGTTDSADQPEEVVADLGEQSEDDLRRAQQRRSGARWGALGMVLLIVGILIGVVAQFVFASGSGVGFGFVVVLGALAAIGFGYFRFWSSENR